MSDHKPILLIASNTIEHKELRPKRFRFEAKWIKEEECEDIIRQGWKSNGDICNELIDCKNNLISWRRKSHIDTSKQIPALRKMIDRLQQGEITERVKREFQSLSTMLEGLLEREDLHWKQRSKLQWYSNGNRNTSFFHANANKRRAINNVRGLRNLAEQWCERINEREEIIKDHFGKMFTSSNPTATDINLALERVRPR